MKGGGGTNREATWEDKPFNIWVSTDERSLCSLIIRTLLLNLTSPLDRDREREGAGTRAGGQMREGGRDRRRGDFCWDDNVDLLNSSPAGDEQQGKSSSKQSLKNVSLQLRASQPFFYRSVITNFHYYDVSRCIFHFCCNCFTKFSIHPKEKHTQTRHWHLLTDKKKR